MLKMPIRFVDFPAGHALAKKPTQSLSFTAAELVWGAMSVGKGHLAHMKAHGNFSRLERRFRSYMLQAHLKMDAHGALHRSSLYDGLDPSEKSAVSYFIGMAVTKVLFWRYFRVRWLMHLDIFRKDFSVSVPAGQRPDLFGRDDTGKWYVAESKGRTGGRSETAMAKAKAQARKVASISGVAPHLSVGVLSYYTTKGLHCEVVDPEPDVEGGFSLGVEEDAFFSEYYAPLFKLIEDAPANQRAEREFHGIRYKTVRLDDSGVVLGYDTRLEESLHTLYVSPESELVAQDVVRKSDSDLRYFGPDGLLIELDNSWLPSSMQEEPQTRAA